MGVGLLLIVISPTVHDEDHHEEYSPSNERSGPAGERLDVKNLSDGEGTY